MAERYTVDHLIAELQHNAEMSQELLEQRLADTAAWFFANKGRIPKMDLGKRCDFLEKTCWLLIEINALLTDRVHKVEGKSATLWLPRGVNATGDVRRYG